MSELGLPLKEITLTEQPQLYFLDQAFSYGIKIGGLWAMLDYQIHIDWLVLN